MVSDTYQHGAIDVIGGICGAVVLIKLRGLATERLLTVTLLLAWIGRSTLRYSACTSSCSMLPPWNALFTRSNAHAMAVWTIMLVVHVVCSGMLTGMLYVLPGPVGRWFFPQAMHAKRN